MFLSANGELPGENEAGSDAPRGDKKGERWRPRRPSPLGLMGPPVNDVPKASGWPSVRAIGFMAFFMAAVVLIILLAGRACR